MGSCEGGLGEVEWEGGFGRMCKMGGAEKAGQEGGEAVRCQLVCSSILLNHAVGVSSLHNSRSDE